MPASDFPEQDLRQHGMLVVVSKLCIGADRQPVRHAMRELPKNISDCGWTLHCGSEDAEFTANSSNYAMVPLDRMVATDESLTILFDQPIGTELTRRNATEPWCWIQHGRVVDEDGNVLAEL